LVPMVVVYWIQNQQSERTYSGVKAFRSFLNGNLS
jgi:hypothetical protein